MPASVWMPTSVTFQQYSMFRCATVLVRASACMPAANMPRIFRLHKLSLQPKDPGSHGLLSLWTSPNLQPAKHLCLSKAHHGVHACKPCPNDCLIVDPSCNAFETRYACQYHGKDNLGRCLQHDIGGSYQMHSSSSKAHKGPHRPSKHAQFKLKGRSSSSVPCLGSPELPDASDPGQ